MARQFKSGQLRDDLSLSGSFSGSFQGDGSGLTGIPAVSSSYALTASYVETAQTASYVLNAVSSSYSSFAVSASYAISASHEIIKEVSSSYADTASFAESGNGIFSGSFSGSYVGDGSQLTGIVASKWSGSNPISRESDVEITGSLKVSGSVTSTDGMLPTGYTYINQKLNSLVTDSSIAATYYGSTAGFSNIRRVSDSTLVIGGVTQNYGFYIFGIKHGLNGSTYTTEFENIIANQVTSSGTLINGDLTVIGTGSFDVLITNYESSSIIYSSGSTKFGDTFDDFHQFTGSMSLTGSNVDFTQATGVSGSFSGSFEGNGSGLTDIPASGIVGLNLSQIASGSATASISPNNGLVINTDTEITGTLSIKNEVNNGFQIFQTNEPSPMIRVATDEFYTYFDPGNVGGRIYIGTTSTSPTFTGFDNRLDIFGGVVATRLILRNEPEDYGPTLTITGSSSITGSLTVIGGVSGSFSGSFEGDGSQLTGIISSSYAISASYAVSASHEIIKEVSSSYADTASFAQSGDGIFSGSFSGSYVGDGSGLTGVDPFPFSGSAVITGSLLISSSALIVGDPSSPSLNVRQTGPSTVFTLPALPGVDPDAYGINYEGEAATNTAELGIGASRIQIGDVEGTSGNTVMLTINATTQSGAPSFIFSNHPITASNDFSSSILSTASFGTYLGDGSQLTGILASKWTGSNPISRESDVEITGSLSITGSLDVTPGVINSLTASHAMTASYVDIESLPLVNPIVEYVLTGAITSSGTTITLPNSLTYVSSSIYEYLEIFINGDRLRYNQDFIPTTTSSITYQLSIPPNAEVTYKSLKRP